MRDYYIIFAIIFITISFQTLGSMTRPVMPAAVMRNSRSTAIRDQSGSYYPHALANHKLGETVAWCVSSLSSY